MKKILFLLLLFTTLLNAYSQKLEGTWILDKTIYANGNPLEINHPLFSNYVQYDFLENAIKINERKLDAKYSSNLITTNARELAYSFIDNYLLIQENGDDKIQLLLKKEDFLNKNIEFTSDIEIRNEDTLYLTNDVFKPEFNNDLTFEDFLKKNISKYSSESTKNNLFESEFVLTKDGKIKDVNILNGISKSFDNEFINALHKSETYFKNNTNKDLLIKHNFNFFQMFKGINKDIEKKLFEINKKGTLHFQNNQFEDAIAEYEKLNAIDLTSIKERLRFIYDEAFINLGISYLAINEKEKACDSFSKVGDIRNFKVRNYLLNFCKQ